MTVITVRMEQDTNTGQGCMTITPKEPLASVDYYMVGISKLPGWDQPIKLSSNESALGMSPAAIAAAQQAIQDSHLYPEIDTETPGYRIQRIAASHEVRRRRWRNALFLWSTRAMYRSRFSRRSRFVGNRCGGVINARSEAKS